MPSPEALAAFSSSTGQHPPREDQHPPRVAVTFGALTDPGKVRGRNEDHYLIARLSKAMQIYATSLPGDGKAPHSEEEGYLIVVADGMGGAAAGERASALAVESVEAFVQNTLKWFLHFGQREERVLFEELRESLRRADRTLFERARSNPALWGMGTTLTMAYSVASDLYIVHAGDSRAYLFRDGQLDQITADHTVVQALVDAGMISAEEARHHHRRHVVTNVLGGPSEGVYAEIHKVEVRDGDVLLFCSDGLIEPVTDDAIAGILAEHVDPTATPPEPSSTWPSNCGGPDNVTVVVGRFQVDR